MCGIAGIFSYASGEPVDSRLLEKMTDILAHRGPDGSGYYFSSDKSVGLGHRRLSIIDLETGHQPMTNEDGSVWISFNGEIYNYRELRRELIRRGHIFKTGSDTEVIVHAYEEWKSEFPNRLNGIFGLALWDQNVQSLFLVRDQFGVKPLYFHDDGRRLLFGSELKAILADNTVSREIDLDALNLCLTFRYTPSPWTLFRNIKRLPPASTLIANASGVRIEKYWNQIPEIDRKKREDEWLEELTDAYPAAVKRQMMSDVPIGLSLSGGVDSNAILALMSGNGSRVHTFTVGFAGGDSRDDEVESAVRAAHVFGAEADTQIVSDSDYLDFMEKYIWHLEEPIGNESAPAYHFVARLAQPKVKVLLSGQGADEPFGGYDRHRAARLFPMLRGIPGPVWNSGAAMLHPLMRGSESLPRLQQALTARDETEVFLRTYSIVTPTTLDGMFNPAFRSEINLDLPRQLVRGWLADAPAGTMLERMTYIDTRTSLPDNLLLCGDKMTMAAGIELRVPFLDRELMLIAERIPGKHKVSWVRNKVIHKRACERWLQRKIVHRRKVGFSNPMSRWLTQNLDRLLNEITDDQGSITRRFLNFEIVRQLQKEHKSGQFDHHRFLFLLLSVEMWNSVFRVK